MGIYVKVTIIRYMSICTYLVKINNYINRSHKWDKSNTFYDKLQPYLVTKMYNKTKQATEP